MPISTGPISSTPITSGPITAPDTGSLVTLVPTSKTWVWKAQAAIFSLNLGTVSKAWIWAARVPIITTGVFKIIPSPPKVWVWLLRVPAVNAPFKGLQGFSYEFQYGGLVSAYNTGQLTAQQFYSQLYALQWAFSGLTDWNSSLRPKSKPGDLPPIPLKTFLPGSMISNQADQVIDAATLVATALALLSHGISPRGFPAPYPPPWAFALYGGR